MQWQIYALIDPRTQKIRYVGWTSRAFDLRLSRHKTEAQRKTSQGKWLYQHHRANWLRSLLNAGVWPPGHQTLETGTGLAWTQAEQRWIQELRQQGVDLVNGTDGGEGTPGHTCTPRKWTSEERMAARQRAKEQNLPEIQANRWRNPVYRQHLLAKLNTPELRLKRQRDSRQFWQNNPVFVARLRKLCAIGRAKHWAVPENRQIASETAKAVHVNRLAKGLGPCNHRLTEDDVRQIREKAQTGTKGFIRDMAKVYNVAYITMYNVVHGVTWKHIPGAI